MSQVCLESCCKLYIDIMYNCIFAGILCIQATKTASLGGQQILNCDLNYPAGIPIPYMLEWKKDGLEKPVFLIYDKYTPHIHELYENRVRLVDEISLEISHIQESDEGWYECSVIYVDGSGDEEANGTWIYLNVYSKYSWKIIFNVFLWIW